MKTFAYTREGGGVSVVYPVRSTEDTGMTDEEIEARARAPLPADTIEIEPPTDRTYRDAWVLKDGRITVDMPRARDLHMARIRRDRDAKLKALDVETMKALGTDRLAGVEARKQALRDLPQAVDLSRADTPEALKAIWPRVLE